MARPQSSNYPQRRERIVDIAAKLFARDGYASVPITAIADTAAVSKSLLYHYFASKEDVLLAVAASHIDALLAMAEAGSRDDLAVLIAKFMEEYTGASDRQKVLLNDLDKLPEQHRQNIIVKQRRIVAIVEAALVRARPDLKANGPQARVETMLLFGAINWAHNWYRADGAVTPSQLAALVATRFSHQAS